MKNSVMAILASFILPMSAMADGEGLSIKVFHGTGAPTEYSLDAVRKITFQEDGFTVAFKNAEQADASFFYDEVGKIMFGEVSTGIENVQKEEGSDIAISYDGRTLNVTTAEAAQLRLFDVSGRPVISERISGNAQVSTENLSAGVYILKVNNKTFKFSK